MTSIEKLRSVLGGGCPKRNVCNLHKAQNCTCTHGPYSYCGRYRTLLEPKKEAIGQTQ